MLDDFRESSLPMTVMTPERRKKWAKIGGAFVVLGAGVLVTLGAGTTLWAAWAIASMVVSGMVLLKPSVDVAAISGDTELLELEYEKTHQFLVRSQEIRFKQLEQSDDQ